MNLLAAAKLFTSADSMGPGAVSVSQVGKRTNVAADSSASDQEAFNWQKKRSMERVIGRNLEVFEYLSTPHT
jgi:hypothetical protein